MKKVLVTGANGLLGRALIEKINNRYDVYAVISGRHPVQYSSSVHIVKADLLDVKQCEKIISEIQPEIIIHYAWNVQEEDFEISINNIIWLEASLQLLRFFRVYGGQRFLFAGSVAEYGMANEKNRETLDLEKLSLYGETKRAFTNIMKNYCSVNNIEYVDMRYCSVYGENNNRSHAFIDKAILSLLKGENFVCNYPENIWDYIYIEDAAEATQRLIESDCCGSINICSGIPHKMKDVLTIIGKELDREDLLVFNQENGCSRVFVSDASIMEQKLGYKCKTPIAIGIKKTIEYVIKYKKN